MNDEESNGRKWIDYFPPRNWKEIRLFVSACNSQEFISWASLAAWIDVAAFLRG